MHTVFVVLGGMLAGAAAFTGFLWLVYCGTCFLFEWVAATGWGWLIIPNLIMGPFVGAGLGFVGGLTLCGFTSFSHVASVFVGLASLGFICYVYLVNEKPEWPHCIRGDRLRVRWSSAARKLSLWFLYVPLPCLAVLGLIIWGIMGR